MIVEYIRYKINEERQQAFESAYARAQVGLQASVHCLGYELSRCVEEQTSYILRIEWDSLDGHLKGFRSSSEFQSFLQEIRPFYSDIQEMNHYELTAVKQERESVLE